MAVGSPFLAGLDLERYGLRGAGRRSTARIHSTTGGPACCTARWRTPPTGWERRLAVAPAVLRDRPAVRRALRRHHGAAAAGAAPPGDAGAVRRADGAARLDYRQVVPTTEARALFGGVAAHAFRPLHYPMTSAIGLGIITAGHRHGWPVAAGGSQIDHRRHGRGAWRPGRQDRDRRPDRSGRQLPPADVTMFDLAPEAIADILGDRLPPRVARAYRRFRRGPGAFKVDFAVEGGVPWTNPAARRAGTVHLAGTYAEIAATERDVHAGRMPERPFVLVGQQYLADPQRSVGDIHPVWTYAHVPNGYTGDATAAIIAQIERFAPGFRDRIIGQTVRTHNAIGRLQPQLRRRRHHDRRQGHSPTGLRTANHAVAVPDRRTRHLHLLGGHPTRPRRTRYVRRPRRTSRTQRPWHSMGYRITAFATRAQFTQPHKQSGLHHGMADFGLEGQSGSRSGPAALCCRRAEHRGPPVPRRGLRRAGC